MNRQVLPKKFLFIIPLVLIIASLAVMMIELPFIQTKITQLLEAQGVIQKSQAHLVVEDKNLKIAFSLTAQDSAKAAQFANVLSKGPFPQEITLQLDDQVQSQIGSLFPLTVFMEFKDNSLYFYSTKSSLLSSALLNNEYHYATGSAQALLKGSSPSNFYLEASSPKELVVSATSSGSLVLSPKLEQLFPILGQIATITLRVEGKSVEGTITLK